MYHNGLKFTLVYGKMKGYRTIMGGDNMPAGIEKPINVRPRRRPEIPGQYKAELFQSGWSGVDPDYQVTIRNINDGEEVCRIYSGTDELKALAAFEGIE